MNGEVIAIYTSSLPQGKMELKSEVELVEGQGIVGDRYFFKDRVYPAAKYTKAPREITLIESESLKHCSETFHTTITAEMLRRNVLTKNIDLNALVGQTFTVGSIRLKGLELCQPCKHISDLNGLPLYKWMVDKSGLRAEIVEGGILKIGDELIK